MPERPHSLWQQAPPSFDRRLFLRDEVQLIGGEGRLARVTSILTCAGALSWPTAASAQSPGPDIVVVANPTYASIPMEIDVDRLVAEVWGHIGGYCDISEWFGIPREITSGSVDDFGSVRSVGNEILGARPSCPIPTRRLRRRASTTARSRLGRPPKPRRNWSTRWSSTTRCWRTMQPGTPITSVGLARSLGHSNMKTPAAGGALAARQP